MQELILRSSEYGAESAEMTEAIEALLVAIFGTGSVMVGIIMTILPFIIAFLPIFIMLFIFGSVVISGIVGAIPYYVMSKNNGYKYPWIAFVPLGAMYLRFILSDRKYNLFDKFVTPNRNLAFIAYAIINGSASYVSIVVSCVAFIPIIGSVLSPFTSLVTYAVTIFALFFVWRASYDLLITYGMEKNAMLWSILGCIFPVVFIVVTFIIMKRKPILGTDYNATGTPA